MQWCLVQTGAELFDLLHAYGLGILLAHACGQPIEMRETNWTYTLTGNISAPPSGSLALLDEILVLPDPVEIEAAKSQNTPLLLPIWMGCSRSSLPPLACMSSPQQISRKRLNVTRRRSYKPSRKYALRSPNGKR